jgi:hypothetical protein
MNIKELLDEEDNTNNEELIDKAKPRLQEYSANESENMEKR